MPREAYPEHEASGHRRSGQNKTDGGLALHFMHPALGKSDLSNHVSKRSLGSIIGYAHARHCSPYVQAG